MAQDNNPVSPRGSAVPQGRRAVPGGSTPRSHATGFTRSSSSGQSPLASRLPSVGSHEGQGSLRPIGTPHRAQRRGRGRGSRSRLASSLPVVGPLDEQEAPRPIGVDPAQTGAFARIDASQGATVETRDNIGKISRTGDLATRDENGWLHMVGRAHRMINTAGELVAPPSVERALRTLEAVSDALVVGLPDERWGQVVAALIVLGISFVLLRGCIESANKVSEQVGQPPQQTQTSAEGSVTYQGTVFSISKQDEGTYALVGRRENSASGDAYMQIPGKPAQLVLYNGTIIIPESLDEGRWDVLAYTVGSGSSPVVDEDGNPVGGPGSIAKAELKGSSLLVTDDAGKVTTVSLE